ncbi:hypothetical protein N8I77_013100 [Diaporthe amygdali]|uniref:Uncharacterized protein n=1 Tax=Phomopsis amygdali TaxID=1214568 RepID=A0AAD9S3Q4_PHOAM|nr:hypothetical protein N8I77_013100 [Diaporthe amygdali]
MCRPKYREGNSTNQPDRICLYSANPRKRSAERPKSAQKRLQGNGSLTDMPRRYWHGLINRSKTEFPCTNLTCGCRLLPTRILPSIQDRTTSHDLLTGGFIMGDKVYFGVGGDLVTW